MNFDKITEDGRLWAVRYEGEPDNELFRLFEQWNDVVWLRKFFKENWQDLTSYFKITDIIQAITDTIDDSEILEGVIMDISPDANLEELFRPLSNNSSVVDFLDKMKAKGTVICGPMYPSIDHIYPVSKGGMHAWNNVQLAHRKCNTYKSDSIA